MRNVIVEVRMIDFVMGTTLETRAEELCHGRRDAKSLLVRTARDVSRRLTPETWKGGGV